MAVTRIVHGIYRLWQTRITPFVIVLLHGAAYGILLWALIMYGENHGSHNACAKRSNESGFRGNSDMYGLGIRLGVYLQWVGSSIGSIWLPTEWRSLLTSYVFFNVALLVAMFILTFRFDCTYTAEVIIFLYLWWGGGLVINAGGAVKRVLHDGDVVTAIRTTGNWYQPTTLDAIQASMNGAMCLFSAWFWIRLRSEGETDFVPTPSGTYYFLFSRLRVDNSTPALTFMAFLSVLYCCVFLFFRARAYITSRKLRKGRKTGDDPDTNDEKTTKWAKVVCYTLLIVIFAYTVLAVELTIAWNNVTGVYDVASTGQIIPLILGAGIAITTCWKLKPKELSHYGVQKSLNATFWTNFELDEESNITLLIKESDVSLKSEEVIQVETKINK